jgi:hypothetical protein
VPDKGVLASYRQRCASAVHRLHSIADSLTALTPVRRPRTLHALIAILVIMLNAVKTVILALAVFVLALAGVLFDFHFGPLKQSATSLAFI